MNSVAKLAEFAREMHEQGTRHRRWSLRARSSRACWSSRRDSQRAPGGHPVPDRHGRFRSGAWLRACSSSTSATPAFVADLYGKKFRGGPRDTMFGEMDRLRGRPRGAPAAAGRHARSGARLDEADETRIVGRRLLLWRPVRARPRSQRRRHRRCGQLPRPVRPARPPAQPIKAKVIAFHGWDDPLAPPENVVALGQELTAGGRRLANPCLRHTSRTASPTRGATGAVPGVDTTRSPPSGRGPLHQFARRVVR